MKEMNMVKNDQKTTRQSSKNPNPHRVSAGFSAHDLPGSPRVLDELRELNLAWLKAFSHRGEQPVSALLAGLSPAEHSVMADSPFALFCLSDPVADSVNDTAPGCGLQGDDLALTVSLFAFGWCMTRIDTTAARLVLGLGNGICQRLLVTPLAQLQASIGNLHQIPNANLDSHRVYWQELIAAIRSGSQARQRATQLRGVQLLAALALRR